MREVLRWMVWSCIAIAAWAWSAVVGDEEADDAIAPAAPKAVYTTRVRYRYTGRGQPLPLDDIDDIAAEAFAEGGGCG